MECEKPRLSSPRLSFNHSVAFDFATGFELWGQDSNLRPCGYEPRFGSTPGE